MTSVSLLRGPAITADVTRRFARATARVARDARPAAAPRESDLPADLRSVGDALRDAVASVSSRAAAVRVPVRVGLPGVMPALTPTREMNTDTSTIRMSSTGLGLDTTSAAAPSRLSSTASIGIDGTTAQAASVLSSSATLGLDVTTPEASSTITSTAQANTMPTSYGVVEATFSAGTSVGTMSGVYAGTGAAANATSLTLKITSLSGTVNDTLPTLVSVNVKDQNNTDLGTYSGLITTGGTISLENDIGLSISFGAGTVTQNATTSFTVSNTTPTDVDANAAFNAGVNVRPRFDSGAVVGAGSFTVNGTAVSVLASDSINSVLARINSTVAGVTASFSGDKVTIASTNPSEDAITLADDTSNFLTALKLTSATTVTGNVRDDLQVLSKTTQFATVTTGALTVNGANISVNVATDSLQSIITRINGAGAGVTATYDSAADKVRLTSTANSEADIVVAGDTAGFLTAANLSTGNTVRGNIHDDKQALATVAQFSGVTAGSFTINGVAIAVNPAVDTLQSLITTINASSAGVTASYDAVTNKVTLTTTANSEDDIVVGGDTTGFLTAVKLDAATTVRGNIADDQQVLMKTTQFAAVADGSFVVNGQTITVNRAIDSLQSLIARINGSGAGVIVSYDAASNKVVFTPATPGSMLVIEQDTSGFLAATAIAEGARGTKVNAGAAFNGTGASSPLFDAGQSVGAGSFTVNGVSISVAATDTLSAVLARITASEAGVTASYDADADTVRLVSKSVGPTPITLGSDTSGLLAAVKLDGTEVGTAGRLRTESTETPQRGGLATAEVDPVAAAIAKVNAVLDRLAGSRDVAQDFRVSILDAVRGAVGGVSASETGLSLSRGNGKEKLVIDSATLAEALTNNPQALDGLVNGEEGLPEALIAALAADAAATAAAPSPSTTTQDARLTLAAAQSVRLATQLRMLQVLDTLPTTSRQRLDLLV